jgi:plastocyanin
MNYTVAIRQLDPAVSHVALSVECPVPGVTLSLSQKEFTFLGESQGVTLGISVDSSVTSSTLPVEIIATTAMGVQSAPFTFTLEKGLVLVAHFADGLVKPVTVHVNAGQTVTWLDLIPVDDDGLGPLTITLLDGSAASPTLQQYELWSHAFSQPGTYTYKVDTVGFGSFSATVTVS